MLPIKKLYSLIDLYKIEENSLEADFRNDIMGRILPVLIFFFLIVAYIAFPLKFGFHGLDFYSIPNVR